MDVLRRQIINGNMKKRPAGRYLATGLLLLGVLFDLLLMVCNVPETGRSVLSTASLWITNSSYTATMCFVFILLLVASIAVSVMGIWQSLFKRKAPLLFFVVDLFAHIVLFSLSNSFQILGGIGVFLIILHLLFTVMGTIYCIAAWLIGSNKKKRTAERENGKTRRRAIFAMGLLSMLLTFVLFYVPFCSYTANDEVFSLVPLGVLSYGSNNRTLLVVFLLLAASCTVSFVGLLKCFERYSSSESAFAGMIRNWMGLNALITGAYFVAGVALCVFSNAKGGMYTTESYVPFLLSVTLMILFACLTRGTVLFTEGAHERIAKGTRMEFFLYGLLVAAVTVIAAMSDILQVTFTDPATLEAIHLNGYSILKSFNGLEEGFQLIAFLLLSILTVIVGLFISSLIALISRSKLFYKITLAEILCGALSSLLLGLFGKYYEIVQQMNEKSILSWISKAVDVSEVAIEYEVTSQSFYWFLAVMAIVAVVLIRKPYTRGTLSEALLSANEPQFEGRSEEAGVLPQAERTEASVPQADADPCPAFTELDRKADDYRAEQREAEAFAFEKPTLPGLVQYVVNYARDSRLHLSYTAEDIAAFVAGLGAARLTVLQGMSGTGKTSLPKIFTEAIFGTCDIIEVESSWRDKHELLGYYNEFSRTYTPKKFTQALYKAKLNPERLTFIVLDEMNLSRIEYYFSDFLSLMEHEEDKREIKLLNVGLYRTENGIRRSYLGLSDGHTIRIPNNVWFVGTANRDESTFEISDKVYDRAHTMNFNKRAPKVIYRHEPMARRYLSVNALLQLFEEAKGEVHFDLDTSTVVREVEELLAPYNISFGNRVANQMETFVNIYTACFTPTETVMQEALETILLSKVVSKLEFKSIENKERLAAEFRRLRLYRCSEFVEKLHED